jgi:Na+-translocating ferredoxin:NAD+ oxidoreductase subunit B
VSDLVEQIDALLPQTQCTRCGYPACRPYAEALAAGSADINQCPPGGEVTIRALAHLLGRDEKPLNPQNGSVRPATVAYIDEARCIGCAKCLPACPVDAIIGAARFTHTVIAERCTGCDLCLPPCPVDCIELRPAPGAQHDALQGPRTLRELQHQGAIYRRWYEAASARRQRDLEERQQLLAARKRQAGTWRKPGSAP